MPVNNDPLNLFQKDFNDLLKLFQASPPERTYHPLLPPEQLPQQTPVRQPGFLPQDPLSLFPIHKPVVPPLTAPPIPKALSDPSQFNIGSGRIGGKDLPESFETFPGERLRNNFLAGVGQTVGSMLGAIEWLADSDIARDMAVRVQDWAKQRTPVDPTFFDQVTQGFGSAAIFYIPGIGIAKGAEALANIAPRLAIWLGIGVSTALESVTEAGSVYQNVLAQTKDKEKASQAATNTLIANIPLNVVTNRLGIFSNKGGPIKRAINSAFNEAGQEGAQEIISAINEERKLELGNIATSAGVGAVVGGSIGIVTTKVIPEKFKFQNPEFEQRFKAAQGVPIETTLQKAKDVFTSLKNKVTREFEHLPKTAEFAQLRFDLLRLSKQKGVASDKAIQAIGETIAELSQEDFDLFTRKVVMDDLTNEADDNRQLPFGLTPESLRTELPALTTAVAQNSKVQEALTKRQRITGLIKEEYIASMTDIGLNIGDRLNNDNYFRHQVLEHMNNSALYGTGAKLKTPASRGFLRQRAGSESDINTDYLQAEHEVLAQMIHDVEIAQTIKSIDMNYNFVDDVKKLAENKGLEDWHDAIPDGYTTWQPREGNVFYMANAIPENIAEELFNSELEEIGITRENIRRIMAVGRQRTEFVVKDEVADTLNGLQIPQSQNMISKANKAILKKWKIWVLGSPRRTFKYNVRNLTGDADAAFVGNPSTFKESPRATKELWNLYFGSGDMTLELQDWFDRGGMQSTLQVQEIGDINRLSKFRGIKDPSVPPESIPKKAWRNYWNNTRQFTDFRESILRYSAYLDYLNQIKSSPAGQPKNFGASISEEIEGLSDPRDKAFFLSNDLLGAYDRVSVMGKALREHIKPFWSWKEVNFKRYIQFTKNAVNDGKMTETVGRKAVGSLARTPFIAARVGKFLIKASAFWAMFQAWNQSMFPEEEASLSEREQTRPHIVLGRDDEGNVISFNRIGALGDFLEWFGLDAAPRYVKQWLNGKRTLREIAGDMAKSGPNVIAQSISPLLKIPGEIATRRALYPDVFQPRTIRDRGLHVANGLGLSDEYIAVFGRPSRGYAKSLTKALIYKTDPLQTAYSHIAEEKFRFLKKIGKFGEGFWLTPRGDALYNYKLSLKFKDKGAADKYLKEYVALGGTEKGIKISLGRMHPTGGLSKKDIQTFIRTLTGEDQAKLKMAVQFYKESLKGRPTIKELQ